MNGINSSVENTKGCSTAASLRFVRMNENANAPTYGSANAAGADLCSAENCVVPPHGRLLVSTGLQVAVPPGHYGRVAPRSGLAVKHFIDVGAGVVDEDYRGELKVLLFNFSDAEFSVKVGDRIAQFICEKCTRAELVAVDSLDETARGAGGFGSTGINNKIA
ncbi:dUTPase domain-containing protein [Ditylenchus destructor]|nr:dUTPase domain-containing protein [Ditylenchus destructor]